MNKTIEIDYWPAAIALWESLTYFVFSPNDLTVDEVCEVLETNHFLWEGDEELDELYSDVARLIALGWDAECPSL